MSKFKSKILPYSPSKSLKKIELDEESISVRNYTSPSDSQSDSDEIRNFAPCRSSTPKGKK